MSNFRWFSDEEVAKWQLQTEMWAMLDVARNKSGVPYIITSGRRSPDQEIALKGGVRDSSHISGWGVDLAISDDHVLALTLLGLYFAGFKRMGTYIDAQMKPVHLHVDADPDLLAKTGEVFWIQFEQNC